MSFFTYDQNNTGGSFDYDEAGGITHFVIVEAASPEHADQRAEAIGLYWNGCADGRDCPCCGDRWDTAYGKGDAEPRVYGKPAADCVSRWMAPGRGAAVHYLDGRIEWPALASAEAS